MATTNTHTIPEPILTEREELAWKGFLRTHALLSKQLDAELEFEHRLSLSSYEVLRRLAMSETCRMRMSDLAESVILSRSGLTRLIDRLERDGLIERTSCPQDARGLNACLTDEGRRRFDAARVTHLAGVRRRFLEHLEPAQLDALATVWDRLGGLGPAGESECCGP